jgi:site-specific recombinase XerD
MTEGAEVVKLDAVPSGALVPAQLVEAARDFAAESKAVATRRAYRRQWAAFVGWCDSRRLPSLPATPEAVALYVTERAQSGAKVPTLEQALAAIAQAHKTLGHSSPRTSATVQTVMAGIRRTIRVATRQKAPVMAGMVKAMVATLPATPRGLRDRALLLVGFAGAFRRSELVGLDVADLAFTEDGLEVTLRRSKTDQEGVGRKVGIPCGSTPETCPVRALRAWIEAAGITEGPVFREVIGHRVSRRRASGRAVARLVKRTAQAAGFDSSGVSAHSLRSGLATSAAKAGKSERAIMKQTGHGSVTMVRQYIRDAELFSENAAAGLL